LNKKDDLPPIDSKRINAGIKEEILKEENKERKDTDDQATL
jgi:hypothetical protein